MPKKQFRNHVVIMDNLEQNVKLLFAQHNFTASLKNVADETQNTFLNADWQQFDE